MRRGNTPTHTFTAPFDILPDTAVRIVYAQNDRVVLERTTESCTIDGNKIIVDLSQEETLLFDTEPHYEGGKYQPYPVEIQVGIRTAGGKVAWSDIITDTVERILRKDGVV